MTDTNSRLSKPRNKSFDKNIQLHVKVPKICFNPYCNERGTRRLEIIGTAADYRDHRIPYCLCDKCFLPFIGWGPGRDHNESLKSIPELKVCYNRCCNSRGKYWIDIYKNAIVEAGCEWLGVSMPYWICERCYVFFEDKRKDFTLLFTTIFHKSASVGNELKEEDRIAVTVEEFISLIESDKTKKNKSDTPFHRPVTRTHDPRIN